MRRKLLGSLLFAVPWLLYCGVVLAQRRAMPDGPMLAGALGGAVFMWLTGLAVLWLARGGPLRGRGLALASLALLVADQAAKLAVYTLLAPSGRVDLAGGWLSICFAPNRNNNVLFNLLGVQLGSRWLDVLFKLAALLAAGALAAWYLRKQPALLESRRVQLAGVLVLAAAASSVIDTAAYGFVLDFIALAGLVAFDFKDLYLQWGLVLLVLELLDHEGRQAKAAPPEGQAGA